MKADPFVQERLLELPRIDQRRAQLGKEARTSPLKEEAARATEAVTAAEEEAVELRTRVKDLERDVARAERDVETVRARVERDNVTLDSGAATAKQLTDIQHELTSLARRQAELEDVELEIMERMEEASTALDEAQARMEQARSAARESAAAWERRSAEITEETSELDRLRNDVVAELPGDLVALYEKVRERSGQGAGLLHHGRCGACQLQLSSSDLDAVRSAASDEVLRCQECGAILVRTEESGL